MTDIQVHSCGHGHAHLPHPSRLLAGWWCPGVMPVWPCPVWPRPHSDHFSPAGNYHCPGTTTPPRDITGPPYTYVDVGAAIEASQENDEHAEDAEQ